MTTPYLSFSWLKSVDSALRKDALAGRFNLDFLLTALRDVGFQKLRYFEYSENTLVDKSYYVLRATTDDIDRSSLPAVSLPSEEINQYVPIGHLRPKPFVGSDLTSSSPTLCEFQDSIGTKGMPSIFIPIHAGEDLSGKLCASWPGKIGELKEHDLDALSILSQICGRSAKLSIDSRLSLLFQKISTISFNDEADAYYDAHSNFLEILNEACPSKILAVFESNWANSSIEKICERRFQNPFVDVFNERYEYGEHLSGFAFSHKQPLLITSVGDLRGSEHPKISQSSIERHSDLIGSFDSILFAPFESGHRDFVVRLISRNSAACENFSNSDLYAVEQLCRRYGEHSNEFANEKNLQIINTLFQISISDFSRYTNVIDEFSTIYSRIFDGEVSLIAREVQGTSIEHIYSTTRQPFYPLNSFEPKGFEKLLKKIGRDPVSIMRLDEFENTVGLKKQSQAPYTHVFIISFEDADVQGVIFSTISSTNSSQAIRADIKPKTAETLKIIGAVIASSISASSNHITTENAKRLIGHIGHEIESPVADLIDLCKYELRKTKKQISNLELDASWQNDVISEINIADTKIEERSKDIALLMGVAVDMAQETEHRLDLTYDRVSLGEILREASGIVEREAPDRLQPIGTKVLFEFNDRLNKLPFYVGDRTLLQKAFVNLLRNAVKYSYPQERNAPITIKVRAIEQTQLLDLEIENWGVPINPIEVEKIFKPFERGTIQDPVRARRGMGLGLYIARRFLEAHEGSVRCISSDPTLDDPQRMFTEGHKTIFGIRLPKGHRLTGRGSIQS